MNEARETALMMAASINPHGNTVGQLLRDARRIECYLTGQADAIERTKTGPQPPETDPDFAEVGDEIDCSAVTRAILRATLDGESHKYEVLTPNDVTRGRCIMREMLSKNGWTAPHVTLCDDIVRTILRGFLYARSE